MLHTSLCASIHKWNDISASYEKNHPNRQWADGVLASYQATLDACEKRILDRQFWL